MLAAGSTGERLCVRNSGALVVVEGCGDHGCEYMTGGVVLVLGPIGRNFGAGMSGGIAYVLEQGPGTAHQCDHESVTVTGVTETVDADLIRSLLDLHQSRTGSVKSAALLKDWWRQSTRFRVVTPRGATAKWQQIQAGLKTRLIDELQTELAPANQC